MDIILWVITPYTFVAIGIMAFIWKHDYRLQEESEAQNVKIEKKSILLLKICSLGYVLTGASIVLLFKVYSVHTFLFSWIIGLVTLNPNMNQIAQQPAILAIHVFFAIAMFVLFMKNINFFYKTIIAFKTREYKWNAQLPSINQQKLEEKMSR
ncbi:MULTISPECIES: respiratory nitrate reductase subunit gamma [Bacillus]|uniref:respiratory nitrate reductase subunit gamma n=1 Tax=Bacillus TaxID=1386 RepID=UPI001D0D09A5|nr:MULTISPECIES: respiratory nitrate reductase subunit gamma [Bacillus]